MSDAVEIPLREPIKAHGETLTVLTLRAPTGREIRQAGYPFRISGDQEMCIDASSVAKLISSLGAIPPSSVDLLSAPDWNACMTVVLGFFGATDPSSSTAGSSALGGGATPASSGN